MQQSMMALAVLSVRGWAWGTLSLLLLNGYKELGKRKIGI